MNKKYLDPEMDVTMFENNDVITTSPGFETEDDTFGNNGGFETDEDTNV